VGMGSRIGVPRFMIGADEGGGVGINLDHSR
jgi:hypothetical protein